MTTGVTSTSDFCFATATELARRIRDRETSSTEVTEAFLARIVAHNGTLNAIVHLFERDARSRAKEADDTVLSNGPLAPLQRLWFTCSGRLPLCRITSFGARQSAGALRVWLRLTSFSADSLNLSTPARH